MDTKWLHDFVILAEVKNFTHAADLRYVSQAAFSRRIQALEQWLGTKLIDRTTFPMQLTQTGERFRVIAVNLLNQISDAKSEVGDTVLHNHLRIATPYSLATTRFPDWWQSWVGHTEISCSLEIGNVHDAVSAMNAGLVDILIGYNQAMYPVKLEEARFDRHDMCIETIKPYASKLLVDSGRAALPGTRAQPIPLLVYAPTAYFARLVDMLIENAPQKLFGYRVFEAEMSHLLRDLAIRGMGVAWLSESSFQHDQIEHLQPIGNGEWDIKVSIVAYRNKNNDRKAVSQIWERIVDTSEKYMEGKGF